MEKMIKTVLKTVPRKYLQRVSHLGCRLLALTRRGNVVECPICEAHYREFIPFGYVHVRQNALCPNCLALERHRLMWLYLQRETNFFITPARVLHIAPEYCFLTRFDKQLNLDYVSADLESPLAKVHLNVENIPFEEEHFDVIFCNHVLEHVNDDRKAMSELHRVLKRGGWGILLSPVNPDRVTTYEDPTITNPKEREKAFGQHDHLRDYGTDYAQRLREAGFRVEELDYIQKLSPEMITHHALRSEVIYLVHK